MVVLVVEGWGHIVLFLEEWFIIMIIYINWIIKFDTVLSVQLLYYQVSPFYEKNEPTLVLIFNMLFFLFLNHG